MCRCMSISTPTSLNSSSRSGSLLQLQAVKGPSAHNDDMFRMRVRLATNTNACTLTPAQSVTYTASGMAATHHPSQPLLLILLTYPVLVILGRRSDGDVNDGIRLQIVLRRRARLTLAGIRRMSYSTPVVRVRRVDRQRVDRIDGKVHVEWAQEVRVRRKRRGVVRVHCVCVLDVLDVRHLRVLSLVLDKLMSESRSKEEREEGLKNREFCTHSEFISHRPSTACGNCKISYKPSTSGIWTLEYGRCRI